MNILFVTSAPITVTSSANIQNISYIKGFVELGHSVTILCAESEELQDDHLLNKLGLQNVRICGIPYSTPKVIINDETKKNGIRNKIKKILRDVYHRFAIFDHYKILVNKLDNIDCLNDFYDIMITASDPRSSHLIGKWIKQNKREIYGKWIQLYGDPIYLDINNRYFLPGWYIKSVEKRLIKKADKVFYVSLLTLKAQQKLYKESRDKLYMIPLSYPEKKIYNNKTINKNKIKLGYFGNYNFSIRNIKPLYNTVSKLSNIELLIVGNSDKVLESKNNIIIKKRVHYSEIEKLESEVDILVGLCNLRGTQIPGKLYYYAGTNKPVMFMIDGTSENKKLLKRYIESIDRFIICENEESDIKKTLENIINIVNKKNHDPIEEFSSIKVAEKFISMINTTK